MARVGVEGTGAYGAGLARHLRGQGLVVIEVDRPNRQERRRNGKSDELDAIEAARAALSGRASGIAKSADGDVEAIRALLVARRSGRNVRDQVLEPDPPSRASPPPTSCENGSGTCPPTSWHAPPRRCVPPPGATPSCTRRSSRSRRWDDASSRSTPTASASTTSSTRSCADRARACSRSTASAPTPPRSCWSPPATTRTGCSNEAAFAHLCGVAPLPASSGKTQHRHRLNPGGNRQANHALWRIVFTRMSSDERTRKYVARRIAEGRTTREIMRVLKRYVAREIYPHLVARLTRSGVAGLAHECPDTDRLSFERTAGPSLPNTLGTAWPHKSSPSPEWPITGLPAPPKHTLDNT